MALDFKIEPPKDEWVGARDAFTRRLRLALYFLVASVAIAMIAAMLLSG